MNRDYARATLLRALEQLDDAESDLGAHSDIIHLCVVYSAGRVLPDGRGFDEVGGWVNTSGPLWLHAAMLRRAANAIEDEEDAENEEEG